VQKKRGVNRSKALVGLRGVVAYLDEFYATAMPLFLALHGLARQKRIKRRILRFQKDSMASRRKSVQAR
jgi:hypothetical protein